MAEISLEALEKKRDEFQTSIYQLQGAIEAINMLITQFYPPQDLTMADLKRITGAQSVGEPEPLEGGEK